MDDGGGLLGNNTFWVSVACGITAQTIKVVGTYLRERRVNFKQFVEMGGMPSAHSAAMAALAMYVGLDRGFGSALFAITLLLSLMVMYDAAGLRRAAGQQAEILNRIFDDLYASKRIRDERLRELLGHTPIEVIAGALLGIIFAVTWHAVALWRAIG
jgi:acid phosphatase family membrane protein YuiD